MKLVHIAVGEVWQNPTCLVKQGGREEFSKKSSNLDNKKNSSEFFESVRVVRPEPLEELKSSSKEAIK
jgi:hypothetical protein